MVSHPNDSLHPRSILPVARKFQRSNPGFSITVHYI
jgi:hypothetical protein